MPIDRDDNFEERRKHLQDLSDKELKERFWNLAEEIVDPLIDTAETHTSQSIERSVLLRMGFNSLDAKAIVKKVAESDLLGKGAGHVLLKLAEKEEMEVKEAGLAIVDGEFSKKDLKELFNGGEK
ncbi:MAG TPA: ornithine aminomutase subunit alpha [Halanaerobiales bacterium]|nr:ornithine aminomutase subunit alpha [Halanaerobiales bacterium]